MVNASCTRNETSCCIKGQAKASPGSHTNSLSFTCWGQEGELVNLPAAKICFSDFTYM